MFRENKGIYVAAEDRRLGASNACEILFRVASETLLTPPPLVALRQRGGRGTLASLGPNRRGHRR